MFENGDRNVSINAEFPLSDISHPAAANAGRNRSCSLDSLAAHLHTHPLLRLSGGFGVTPWNKKKQQQPRESIWFPFAADVSSDQLPHLLKQERRPNSRRNAPDERPRDPAHLRLQLPVKQPGPERLRTGSDQEAERVGLQRQHAAAVSQHPEAVRIGSKVRKVWSEPTVGPSWWFRSAFRVSRGPEKALMVLFYLMVQ